MSEPISPGERRELRAVVRSQFKVLRTEVKQREVELDAEAESRILDRYRRSDELVEEARRLLQRKMDDVLREMQAHVDEVNVREGTNLAVGRSRFGDLTVGLAHDNRVQERRTLKAAIEQQVKTAALNLDRQESDLLRAIATDALESEEAKMWLARIPSVAELVPSRRLQEIEAQFQDRTS